MSQEQRYEYVFHRQVKWGPAQAIDRCYIGAVLDQHRRELDQPPSAHLAYSSLPRISSVFVQSIYNLSKHVILLALAKFVCGRGIQREHRQIGGGGVVAREGGFIFSSALGEAPALCTRPLMWRRQRGCHRMHKGGAQ
jgi:hypothetical protein